MTRPSAIVLIALALLALLTWCGSAPAATISGHVYEAGSRRPLPAIHLSLHGTQMGAVSDDEGGFRFQEVPSGRYQLVAVLPQYRTFVKDLQVGHAEVEHVEVLLEPWIVAANEVVVTATRWPVLLKDSPVTTELISRSDIVGTGATTVDEALKAQVGIDVDEDFSGVGVSLRGMDPTRVLVLVDGKRAIGRVRGSIDLSQFSTDNVERIELVKGTGATLYGSDAIGGVLNIITRQPGDGLRIGVRQEFTVLGNGGNRTFLPSVQFESAHEDWGIVADAGYRHADGFDLQPETPHTNGQEEISRFSGGLKLIYDPESKWRYGTSGRVMWEEKDWRESEYFEPLQQTFAYDDRERNVRADVGVQASWNPDQHTGYTVGGHISYYDHWWKKWSETGHLVDSSVTVEHYQEVSFSGRRRLSRAHLPAYGLDFTNNVFESDMLSPDREGVQTFDGYYQHEWRVTHGVTALPGVRYEHHSAYGDHVNPSLNAMWRPCSHFRLRGMVARGFRAPSIKELYFRFDHSAAGYIVEGGGAGLDPETSINSSLTMEFTKGERYLSRITYFYNHLRDLIDFDLVGFSEVYWRGMFKYRNVRKAYTCGVEYEMDYRPNENLRLELGYTYLRARDLGTGETLLNRPENKVQLKLSGRVERWDAGGSFWGSWTDRKLWSPITEAGGTGPGSWAPDKLNLNINLYKNLNPSVRAFFNIYNVTDEVNADYGYWPGRTFGVGFTYEFGQD